MRAALVENSRSSGPFSHPFSHQTPTDRCFVLPDGRLIEIRQVLVRSQNFAQWGLGQRQILPNGYIRI